MAFHRIFGLLDIVAAVVILLSTFQLMHSWRIVVVFALCLIVKGLLFIKNFVSMLDVAIGIYMIALIISPFPVLSVVFSAHLLVKGCLSVFA